MKKAFISFLIMTLMITNIYLVNISSVQAATTDDTTATSTYNTTKVSLDNIKEIMTENNLDIKILFNKMKIANETYHDALDTYQDYQDEYDEDDDAPVVSTKPTDTNDVNYESELEEYYSTSDALAEYNKWKTAKTAYESDLDAYKIARDAYEAGIEDKVNLARQAYLEYISDVSARELQENVVKVQQREVQKYKLQYESGFLSKNEFNASLPDMTTANNTLSKLKNEEELAKSNLCTTLGFSSSEKVTFSTDIEADLEKVSQINYDDDLGEMLDDNVDIRTANTDIDDLKDEEDTYDNNDQEDIYDYTMANDEATLKQALNIAESDFKEQYNTLMSSYNTMKSDYDSLNVQKTDYNTAQLQYNYGFTSKNDMEDAKIGTSGLDSVNSTYENAKSDFYVNYLRYLQMKEGY